MPVPVTQNFDASFLGDYYDELSACFKMYMEDINPFIVQFEIEKGEFPIEIQNEIRSIYGHLCRAAVSEKEEIVSDNIKKIKSHTKRAMLDCYKYCCIIYTDMYADFMKQYENIDLTFINNGTFLPEINMIYKEAKDKLIKAKESELKRIPDDDLFKMYQDAFIASAKIKDLLFSVQEDANFLQNKAVKKEKFNSWGFIVGVAGLLVGIVGVIVGII